MQSGLEHDCVQGKVKTEVKMMDKNWTWIIPTAMW